ncbi:hypothetical protein, partial [Xylella fastidiosa]|uniref:hypothetical protein n=1 Tax=Xylella fastidiosa TaxID=2371 RepID=UPI0030CDA4EB
MTTHRHSVWPVLAPPGRTTPDGPIFLSASLRVLLHPADIIAQCVRCYLAYALSHRLKRLAASLALPMSRAYTPDSL